MFTSKSNDNEAIWNSVAVLGSLVILHAISVTVKFMDICTPETVATAAIICGILLYQAIMDITWNHQKHKRSSKFGSKQSRMYALGTDNPISKSIPPIIGALSVLILCLVWHVASVKSTYSTLIPLPSVCGSVANHGKWAKVNTCSEFQKGINGRDYNARNTDKICTPTYQWGWMKNEHSARCPFKFHEPIDTQSKLQGKNVIFMGDTVTRSTFFAFCRALGDINAGSFDSDLPVHSEITKAFGDTTVAFQWAPLTSDVLERMKSVQAKTDLVIAGSGALDKLHLWATEEDKSSYELTVQQLAKDLKFLKDNSAPVVWFTPTTVNTKALPSEEKRTQMSEENVEEIRKMYSGLQINEAASFVLDGPGFTKDQVHRSYDGIHYPPQVYDVGAQILINALDWLLPLPRIMPHPIHSSFKPKPGSMANPILGLMVLCCVCIGLLFFDGYLGFSYLASVFLQPMTAPAPNRVALFYTSKEEQSRYSFMPQDLYAEICRLYEKKDHSNVSSSKKESKKSSVSEYSRKDSNNKAKPANSNNAPGRDDFSAVSMNSRRTFGLATINEDSHSNLS